MNGSLNLKIFLSVSLGLHLLFFSALTLLYPDFKIHHIPPLHIEVSLFPLVPETRAASNPIPKPELEMKSHESHRRAELPDSALPAKELVRRTGVQAQITIHEQRELFREEKKEEPLIKEEQRPESLAAVQDEAKITPDNRPPALTIESEKWEMGNPKEEKLVVESYENPIPATIFSDKTQTVMKNPSLSEGEVLFIQPKYAENIKPIYPQEARRKGYEGEVILRVEVLPNGRVGQIEIKSSSGYELLDRSALTTVRRWKFVPAQKGEEIIPLWVNIPIKFQLQ